MPDDELEADARADEIDEKIIAAINPLGLGILNGSVSVADWTTLAQGVDVDA